MAGKILSPIPGDGQRKIQGLSAGEKDGAEKPKPVLSAKRLFGKELIQIDRGAVSGEKAGYMRGKRPFLLFP